MTADQTTPNQPEQESIAMLSKARDECFSQIGNSDLPLETRNEFSARHKKLGDIIDQLIAKRFHETSTNFKNQQDLKASNATLSKQIFELDCIGKNLDTAQKFFNVLDQVIQVGASLITLV